MDERLPVRDSRLAREKGGQVPCDAGILRIRQANLRQTCASRGARKFGESGFGHEAIDENSRHIVTCQFDFDGAANQSRTATGNRDRSLLRVLGSAKRSFFRLTASVRQSSELPGIQILALREMMRQREVHVVAAEEDMIPNRHARELQVAILFGNGDQ